MGYELVGSGSLLDALSMMQYDEFLDEGQKGLLELDLRVPVGSSLVSQLETSLRQQGVEDVKVSTGSPLLRIEYRKGMPWLAIIVAAVLGIIALALLIIGWRFFREVMDVIPDQFKGVAAGAIIIAVLLVSVAVVRRR